MGWQLVGSTSALQSGVWHPLRCDAKGCVRLEFLNVRRHASILTLQKVLHGVCEGGVGQPMGAVRGHWHQRTGHLVLALGTALKCFKAVRYAPGQGLVIAGVEVQAVHPLQRPPVPAIGCWWRKSKAILASSA